MFAIIAAFVMMVGVAVVMWFRTDVSNVKLRFHMLRLSFGLTLIAIGIAAALVRSLGTVDRINSFSLSAVSVTITMIAGALLVVSAVNRIMNRTNRLSEQSSATFRDGAGKLAILKDAHSRLLALAASGIEISETLAFGGPMLRRFVKHDMVSLAVVDDRLADMKRYSVTESGNRILERGLSLPVRNTAVEQVVRSHNADITGTLDGIQYRDDAWLSKCGFRSRISVPVMLNDRVMGVLSFVSISEHAYSESDISRVSMLTDIFAVAIRLSGAERRLRSLRSQVTESWELLSRLADSKDIESFQCELVRFFTDSLPATYCRLSLYEEDSGILKCLAEHNRRTNNLSSESKPTPVRIDRMPWHNSAVQSEEVVIFNQSDKGRFMTSEEVGLGFPNGVRSGMILPVKAGNKVRGVISIGEMRDWKRRSFSSDDIACAEMMAAQASLAIAMTESNSRNAPMRQIYVNTDDNELLSLVGKRLASPLSSILGASELLEKELKSVKGKPREYVAIVRRNVEKAAKAIDEFRELRRLSDIGNNINR